MLSNRRYLSLTFILLLALSLSSGIQGNEAPRFHDAPGAEKGGPIDGPGPKPDPVPESNLEKMIVFTANQEFLSRIYLLRMDGTVYRYFEFFAYRFVDVEVIDNELYAAEAFAPRVYKVDLYTGDLEVTIDDWSLYYFYGICFDGNYFYLDEWDFRRYDIDGNFKGSVPFSDPVYGSAWDGDYLWIQGTRIRSNAGISLDGRRSRRCRPFTLRHQARTAAASGTTVSISGPPSRSSRPWA